MARTQQAAPSSQPRPQRPTLTHPPKPARCPPPETGHWQHRELPSEQQQGQPEAGAAGPDTPFMRRCSVGRLLQGVEERNPCPEEPFFGAGPARVGSVWPAEWSL